MMLYFQGMNTFNKIHIPTNVFAILLFPYMIETNEHRQDLFNKKLQIPHRLLPNEQVVELLLCERHPKSATAAWSAKKKRTEIAEDN